MTTICNNFSLTNSLSLDCLFVIAVLVYFLEIGQDCVWWDSPKLYRHLECPSVSGIISLQDMPFLNGAAEAIKGHGGKILKLY